MRPCIYPMTRKRIKLLPNIKLKIKVQVLFSFQIKHEQVALCSLTVSRYIRGKTFLTTNLSFHFYLTQNFYTFTEEPLAQYTTKFTLTFSKYVHSFLLGRRFKDIMQTSIFKRDQYCKLILSSDWSILVT